MKLLNDSGPQLEKTKNLIVIFGAYVATDYDVNLHVAVTNSRLIH